ncbi:MAG: TIGR03564 family F420-dependent LLM class oxidoreductase [Acidimicrobiales bacterium]|nr:MAG: TIGR03564 family F420-dependent LLM class oxidoreductase [Acidimicrobiales bacterium]
MATTPCRYRVRRMELALFDSPSIVDHAVANAQAAKEAGLSRYWAPQVMNADTMVVLGVVASQVSDIGLGTSVMAMQTMMPQTMAQQARTVSQISGGRFTLGIGVNHEPVVTGMWGLPWDKPYSRFVEYLDALIPLINDQQVSVSGQWTTQRSQISVPGDAPDLMLAALGPKMLKLAGERASGTITWMTGPNTIRDHIRPNLGDGSIVAGVSAVVTDDVESSRAFINKALAIYPTLPSYRAVMDREGAEEPADLALIGSAEQIVDGLGRYAEAGTTEVAISRVGNDAQNEATLEAVRGLKI